MSVNLCVTCDNCMSWDEVTYDNVLYTFKRNGVYHNRHFICIKSGKIVMLNAVTRCTQYIPSSLPEQSNMEKLAGKRWKT